MSNPPFSPVEARAARLRMGMTPDQVALSMAKLGVAPAPGLVEAWELGSREPSEAELFALADALWCPMPVLMALCPLTLREHRLTRQLTRERLAQRIGMESHQYARAEADQHWTGTERQTRILGEVLCLGLDEVQQAIGQGSELIQRLRQAVEGRWKGHVGSVAQLVDADPRHVAHALRVLNGEYGRFAERHMGPVVAGRMGNPGADRTAIERTRWLERLPESFRELVDSQRRR